MSFFDRFKKDDDGGSFDSDPFASDQGLGTTPPADTGFGTPPPDTGFGAPPPPDQNFGNPASDMPPGPPPPMDAPAANMDFSNPDINAQTGSPRPREREYDVTQQNPPAAMQANGAPSTSEKDLQLILAKLDSIKSELDSLHQRVRKIEQIAEADQKAAQTGTAPNYGRW